MRKSLRFHLPVASSVRSVDGCVAHALDFFPTANLTRDDETCRVDGSVRRRRYCTIATMMDCVQRVVMCAITDVPLRLSPAATAELGLIDTCTLTHCQVDISAAR